jgi:murein DD-endopeptidase MepM/ murein hydrolase activator NlpD
MTYRTWSLIFVLAVAGQASALPAEVVSQKKVLVKKGENLVAVAERCGTSVEDLIKVNKLEKPYKIYIGQPLVFNKISNRHAPAIEPRGKKTVKTTVSQEPKTRKPVEKPAKVEPVVKDIPLKQPELPVPKQEPVPAQAPKGEPADVKVEDAAMTQPEIKRTGKQFSWPVEGKIISGFGKKKKGLKNDGINIAAKFQSPVKASEDGVVVYAGNEVIWC